MKIYENSQAAISSLSVGVDAVSIALPLFHSISPSISMQARIWFGIEFKSR